jgi:hypothetical protein
MNFKAKAWIVDNHINCLSQSCTEECPRFNICVEYEIGVDLANEDKESEET